MTNGEKMKVVFTDIKMWGESKDTLDYSLGGMIHRVTKSWWNAEYKEPTTKNDLGVLDKLRAEIHANAEMHENGDYYLRDEWIDEIFDKYKAERSEWMRLIDADEVKKKFPLMYNDFGMEFNTSIHRAVNETPTVEAVPMSAIDDIKAEIEHEKDEAYKMLGHTLGFDKIATYDKCLGIIERHLNRKDGE